MGFGGDRSRRVGGPADRRGRAPAGQRWGGSAKLRLSREQRANLGQSLYPLVSQPYNLLQVRWVFGLADHEVSHVRSRNKESAFWQVAVRHAVGVSSWSISESRRAHNCPVEMALRNLRCHAC